MTRSPAEALACAPARSRIVVCPGGAGSRWRWPALPRLRKFWPRHQPQRPSLRRAPRKPRIDETAFSISARARGLALEWHRDIVLVDAPGSGSGTAGQSGGRCALPLCLEVWRATVALSNCRRAGSAGVVLVTRLLDLVGRRRSAGRAIPERRSSGLHRNLASGRLAGSDGSLSSRTAPWFFFVALLGRPC